MIVLILAALLAAFVGFIAVWAAWGMLWAFVSIPITGAIGVLAAGILLAVVRGRAGSANSAELGRPDPFDDSNDRSHFSSCPDNEAIALD